MTEIIYCPACQRKLQLPHEVLGRRVRCPACKEAFTPSVATIRPAASAPALPPQPRKTAPHRAPELNDRARRRPQHDDEDRPKRSRPQRPLEKSGLSGTWIAVIVIFLVVGFLGALAVGGIVVMSQLGQSKPVVKTQPPGMVRPVEDKDERLKDLKEAFQDQKKDQVEDKKGGNKPAKEEVKQNIPGDKLGTTEEITAELKEMFDDLGKALDARDPVRLSNLFNLECLCDELVAQGALPALALNDRQGFIAGMRQSIGPALARQAVLMHWTDSEIKHLKLLGTGRAVVVVRHRDKDNLIMRMRWWVVKTQGAWRIYDYEDLDMSTRLSTAMGSVLVGAGLDVGEMNRIKSLSADLQQAMVAIVVQHNVDLAEQKLKNLEGKNLPRLLDAQRWVLKGLVFLARQQHDAALDAWNNAEAIQPDMPALNLLRAIAYNRSGKWELALKCAEAYRELLGDDGTVCLEIGEALRGLNRHADAAVAYRKALDDNPQSADAFLGLIRSMTPQDNRDDLGGRFLKLTQHRENFDVFANDCEQARDRESLEVLCQAMRKIDGRYAAVDYYDALCKAWGQQSKEAVVLFKSALAKEKDAGRRQQYASSFLSAIAQAGVGVEIYNLMPDGMEAFRILALELKKSFRIPELKSLVTAHNQKFPKDVLLPFYVGEVYVYEGKFAAADKSFAVGLTQPPGDITLGEFRASRVLARYQLGKVMSAYQEIGPKADTFRQLAQLCWTDDKADKLEQLITAHAKAFPDAADTARWSVRLKLRQGKTAEAVKLFKRAVDRPLQEAERQRLIDDFLMDMVDEGLALEAYQAAPDGALAFRTLAFDLMDMGRFDELSKLIDAHRRKHAEDVWLDYFAGQIFLQDKAWDKAAEVLQKAWKNAPADSVTSFRYLLVQALYKSGKAMQAYADIGPRKETYQQLASAMLLDKRPNELSALIEAHRPHAGEDVQFLYHQACALVMSKKPDEAVPLVLKAYQQAKDTWQKKEFISGFVRQMLDAGLALEGYRAVPDKQAAMETLAREYVFKKKAKELAELLEEHGKTHPNDPWQLTY
ncbi:MAG TPA: tetratricopeptide repeat protein, partial [Gemmataceae bacterium]|nr:tetratricopeptide repeat protein [Gemmataceae bacterium]